MRTAARAAARCVRRGLQAALAPRASLCIVCALVAGAMAVAALAQMGVVTA